MFTPRFQSTLPAWGATIDELCSKRIHTISIHAPRVGSDIDLVIVRIRVLISIHAPRVGSDVEGGIQLVVARVGELTLAPAKGKMLQPGKLEIIVLGETHAIWMQVTPFGSAFSSTAAE